MSPVTRYGGAKGGAGLVRRLLPPKAVSGSAKSWIPHQRADFTDQLADGCHSDLPTRTAGSLRGPHCSAISILRPSSGQTGENGRVIDCHRRGAADRAPIGALIGVGLTVASLAILVAPASAAAPPQPATCSFSFGKLDTSVASGTETLSAEVNPAVRYQSCGFEQPFTARITATGGATPAGIQDDPVSYTTFGFFMPDRLSPVVQFVWFGSCTTTAQDLELRVSTAGAAASYPLGTSETCASHGLSSSSLQAAAQPTGQGPPVSVAGIAPAAGGYRLVDTAGRVTNAGSAGSLGAAPATQQPVVAIVAAPSGDGYWLVDEAGSVYSYGSAAFHGSAQKSGGFAGLTPDVVTGGYWLVTEGGGVFSFDAPFYGSVPGESIRPAGVVVGIASTPDGRGYWLGAADGGVFSFGDANFFGSAGRVPMAAPVTAIAATPDGGGYWLVGADGGVFTYGDAGFYGSLPGQGLRNLGGPISGIAPTPDGHGYWLVGADGGVFTYGDARFYGSASGSYSG